MQYLLFLSITKSRQDEPTKVAHLFQKERRTKEMKAAIEAERQAKERALAQAFEVPLKAPSQTAAKFGNNQICICLAFGDGHVHLGLLLPSK